MADVDYSRTRDRVWHLNATFNWCGSFVPHHDGAGGGIRTHEGLRHRLLTQGGANRPLACPLDLGPANWVIGLGYSRLCAGDMLGVFLINDSTPRSVLFGKLLAKDAEDVRVDSVIDFGFHAGAVRGHLIDWKENYPNFRIVENHGVTVAVVALPLLGD